MTMPNVDYLNLAQEAEQAHKGFLSNYLYGSGYSKGGHPTTYQERDYVINFLKETGRAPTANEIFSWKSGMTPQEKMSMTWTPESTMGKMGWAGMTAEERRLASGGGYGEPYGPYAGELVPEGGLVTTRGGKPFGRTYNPETMETYKAAGEYINPEKLGAQKYYPSYDRTQKSFTAEEGLGYFPQQQVYEAKLYDYLTQQIEKDAPAIASLQAEYQTQIDDINERAINKVIDSDEAKKEIFYLERRINEALNNLMTEDKAAGIQSDALSQRDKGVAVDQLPFWNDIKDIMGAKTNELMNLGLKGLSTIETQRLAEIPGEFKGYQAFPEKEIISGTEQRDYYNFVENLPVANEFKGWLSQRFEKYYYEWQENPKEPFMTWLVKTLGGG